VNIYWAGLAAMRRAVEALSPAAEHLLIDARRLRDVPLPQLPIIKGDTKSLSIAAASILAKTARDARMRALDAVYPGYGFAQHKGYPVPAHFRALRRLGPCPIHRRSFGVVREVMGLPPLPPWPDRSGQQAEPGPVGGDNDAIAEADAGSE
jgi:ribonuclease HII